MVTATPRGIFGVLITLVEIKERRRGLKILQTAYKALSNEFWASEFSVGSYFDLWGENMGYLLRRIDFSTAEVATAEFIAERLAVEEREEVSN